MAMGPPPPRRVVPILVAPGPAVEAASPTSRTIDAPLPIVATAPPSATEQPNAGDEDGVVDQPCVFQCAECRTIVGDTTSLVQIDESLGLVILAAASSVAVADQLRLSRAGADSGSTFHALHCAHCKARVGVIYRTTPPSLDVARNVFSFQRDALSSYQLGSGDFAEDPGASAGASGSDGNRTQSMPTFVTAVADLTARVSALEAALEVALAGASAASSKAETALAAALAASSSSSSASRATKRARRRSDADSDGGSSAARSPSSLIGLSAGSGMAVRSKR